jgi:hypothetical protein
MSIVSRCSMRIAIAFTVRLSCTVSFTKIRNCSALHLPSVTYKTALGAQSTLHMMPDLNSHQFLCMLLMVTKVDVDFFSITQCIDCR